jgi:hypothetical protein
MKMYCEHEVDLAIEIRGLATSAFFDQLSTMQSNFCPAKSGNPAERSQSITFTPLDFNSSYDENGSAL